MKHISMTGVFLTKDTRDELREIYGKTNMELELFQPEYSDDCSEDHDNDEGASEGSSN